MLSVALAYYFNVDARHALNDLARIKQSSGLAGSFIAAAIAGGVLPELLAVAVFQRGKVTRANFINVLFTATLWGIDGVLADLLYRLQAIMFGNGVDFFTISKKVFVDQFGYTPLIATPLTLMAYEWKRHGYKIGAIRNFWTRAFFKAKTLPTSIANLAVWLPLVAIIYALPQPLQFPIFSLALTFWVLIFTFISTKSDAPPDPLTGIE